MSSLAGLLDVLLRRNCVLGFLRFANDGNDDVDVDDVDDFEYDDDDDYYDEYAISGSRFPGNLRVTS